MLKKMLTGAVFAGLAAGMVAAILQFWLLTPLLLEGELYESGEVIHFASDGSTQSTPERPDIFEDPLRHLMTLGFNIVTFTGFGFLMVAAFAFAEKREVEVTARSGLIWGLCAFIALQLAPAVGLPPELPGTVGAEVELRQAWWLATVLCSAGGLGLIAFSRSGVGMGAGIVLLLLPHVFGAPELDTYFGVAPPELAAAFVTHSLGISAIAWVVLGGCAAFFWAEKEGEY